MPPIFDAIDELENCAPDNISTVFQSHLTRIGINSFCASTMTEFPSRNLPKSHGIAVNYRPEWMDRYFLYKYENIDPVRQQILKLERFFYWSDMKRMSSCQKSFMNEASDFGLSDGIGVSIPFSSSEIFGVAYSIDSKEDFSRRSQLLFIRFLSDAFSQYFLDKNARHTSCNFTLLSDKELYILEFTSLGKSACDIGDIMGLSKHTVNYHFRNIFRKLECNNKISACIKAFSLGLIVGNDPKDT